MSAETRRFMRLIVLFDLPTATKIERRAYTLFRRFLLNDGYDMIQFSVYGRIVNNHDALNKHMNRLSAHLPITGSVKCLSITEKQFAGIKLMVGTMNFSEKQKNSNQMLLF